jgi:hypothetical protein
MNRIFILAAVGCGLLGGVASAQQMAPPPMGMAGGPVQGVVTGGCGGGGCGQTAAAYGGANAGYARHDSRYGWNPLVRRLAFWKRDNSCGTSGGGLLSRLRGLAAGGGGGFGSGFGGGFSGQGGPAFDPYPNGVPGTLVFPNHFYSRSPRDFFMTDTR